MGARIIGLIVVIGLMLATMSCGGGGNGFNNPKFKYWQSAGFSSMAIALDGSYLTVANDKYIQFYSPDLSLLNEFTLRQSEGGIVYSKLNAFKPLDGSTRQVYLGRVDYINSQSYQDNAQVQLVDDQGSVGWQAQLDPGFGANILDVATGPDGTHYIAGGERVQAISATGGILWATDLMATTVFPGPNGLLYTHGGWDLRALDTNGNVVHSAQVQKFFGTPLMDSEARFLQQGTSPLILCGRYEVLALNADLSLKWRYAGDATDRVIEFFYPVISDNGMLYLVRFSRNLPSQPESEYEYRLVGINTATGEEDLSVELVNNTHAQILGINGDGNIAMVIQDGSAWKDLVTYNTSGKLVSTRPLTYPGDTLYDMYDSSNLGFRLWQVSPTGIVYYQTKVESEGKPAYILVAMDLDGNVVGTVTTDHGYWDYPI